MVAWTELEAPLLFAHRGANHERPENTLAAFELGLELGADVLELDVHPTRDGVFVVSHDPTGERMCGVARAIIDCDWPDIARWDAGVGFVDRDGQRPLAGSGFHPPRFEEVLEAFPNACCNVDVKDAQTHELQKLLAAIQSHQAEQRVLLTSFSGQVKSRVRDLGYQGPLGLSRPDALRVVLAPTFVNRLFPVAGNRLQIPTEARPLNLTRPRLLEKCRKIGLPVDYWVINDASEAKRLLELGADGIMTDDTRAIAAVFAESGRTEAWRRRHPELAPQPR
jgi:glycerophosphoryl diester phosphodiesterase